MIKKEIGLFPMCADVLHAGHILAIQEARRHCDKLIVALNTHPDGKEPVQTVWERAVQLRAIRGVDELIVYQGRADLEKIAATLDYDIRFVGGDYEDKEWDGEKQERERGIEPYYIEREHGFSSTELKQRIFKAQVIRCEDCRFYHKEKGGWCELHDFDFGGDGYCYDGERKG